MPLVYFLTTTVAAFLIASAVARRYRVPILLYHSVSPVAKKGRKISINSAAFERQMRFLKENYNVLPLETLCALRNDNKTFPKNSVAITFDNNFGNFYNYALPIIEHYKLPVTLYVIVGELNKLKPEAIKAMKKSGFIDFASHTISHPYLSRLNSKELNMELSGSKMLLEKQVDSPINSLAYSYGDFNDQVKQKTKEAGYETAVAVYPQHIFAYDDLLSLRRIPITQYSDNMRIFKMQLLGYLDFVQYFGSLLKRTLIGISEGRIRYRRKRKDG